MGSKYSKGKRYQEVAKYGEICVKTDKPSYFGGETVTGQIYLNILMPYPGKQLFIKLKGKEVVDYLYASSSNNDQTTVTTTNHGHKDNNVVNIVFPIQAWDIILPGQYTIPFTFQLPQKLPSSFHHEGKQLVANISYRVEAYLQPDNPKIDAKLKYKSTLIIREPLRHAAQGSDKRITTNIKKCGLIKREPTRNAAQGAGKRISTNIKKRGLIKKGSNTLTAHFDKNWYFPGEAAIITVQLDNSHCKLENKSIRVSLKQYVHIKQDHKFSTKEYTKTSVKLNGVQPGQSSGTQTISLMIPQIQYKDYNEIKDTNARKCLFNIKEDNTGISATASGSLVSSECVIEISCPMKGPKSTKPVLTFPIQIFYPDIQPDTSIPPFMATTRQVLGNVNANTNNMYGQHRMDLKQVVGNWVLNYVTKYGSRSS